MRKLICLSYVIIILLFIASSVSAVPDDGAGNQIAAFDRSRETVNELLLFWDEKDLYVQTATRYEKPISQAAENMTVVTAKEIEDMNAHTVTEVLNRITGVFVVTTMDFGSTGLLHIQGSEERHVLVLLDGIVWNGLSGGNAETIGIPVRIIDRIEVIRGPASSAWGSALGGVINIITKAAGNDPLPSGTVSASYGERNTQDYSGEISGKAGRWVTIYLQATRNPTVLELTEALTTTASFQSSSCLFQKMSKSVSLPVTASRACISGISRAAT